MRKTAILFLLSFGILSSDALAQCNPDDFTSACVPQLGAGFNFLKSYKIDGDGGAKEKVEYSYVFTKGTQYYLNVCATGAVTDGIVVNLFDSNRNQVASNKIDNQYVKAIVFPCNATGIYYIQYTFDKSAKYCGGSALGFKR